MAFVILFGLLTSTFLNMIVVPAAWFLFHQHSPDAPAESPQMPLKYEDSAPSATIRLMKVVKKR